MLGLDFRSLTVGPLETNCYLLWDIDTRCTAIVDPGGDRGRIASQIQALDLRIEWVLLTHGHPDHTFCAGSLASEYGARTGMHPSDAPLLADGLELAEMFYDLSGHLPFSPTDLLADGRIIRLRESEIRVAHTPGHSRGGLCFVTEVGVFCGDTLFAGSVGRTDLAGGSFEQLIKSIESKLLTLDDAVPLYPGHGPATTVGAERQSNPYLQ